MSAAAPQQAVTSWQYLAPNPHFSPQRHRGHREKAERPAESAVEDDLAGY